MTKPVIGITLDYETDKKYSEFPYFALRENYISSLGENCIPLFLPYGLHCINEYLEIIDGLIITGGNFDISPEIYGESDQHEKTSLKKNRTDFEITITKKAINKKIPILGICGGMQLLNAMLGGTLIQHIPDEVVNPLEHETKPYDQASHDIIIEDDSLLATYANSKIVGVNSSHHQAVKQLAPELKLSAKTNDGVIEAFEHPDYPFMIGVQWHPEYQISDLDKNLIKEFIKHCG